MGLFKNDIGRPSNETIKKRRIFYVALVAVLGLTVAFAALSTTLTINGQAKVKKSSWDVHFDNLELIEEKGNGIGNEVGTGTTDAKIENGGIEINNLNAELAEPNDSVVYIVDIVNDGDIDAIVSVNEYFENTLPDQLEVDAIYTEDLKDISEEKELPAGESLHVAIEIKYKDITNASNLLTEDTIVNIKYVLVVNQKVNNEKRVALDFGGDTLYNLTLKDLKNVDFDSMTFEGIESNNIYSYNIAYEFDNGDYGSLGIMISRGVVDGVCITTKEDDICYDIKTDTWDIDSSTDLTNIKFLNFEDFILTFPEEVRPEWAEMNHNDIYKIANITPVE